MTQLIGWLLRRGACIRRYLAMARGTMTPDRKSTN